MLKFDLPWDRQPQGRVGINRASPLAQGLVAHYEGQSDTGIWRDATGRYDAPATGAQTTVNRLGYVWSGARNRHAASTNLYPATNGSTLGIAGWIAPTGSDTTQDTIVQLGEYAAPNPGKQCAVLCNIASARDLYISFNGRDFRTGAGAYTAGELTHFALSVDTSAAGSILTTSTVTLWVNGAAVGLTQVGFSSVPMSLFTDKPIRIARDNGSTSRDFRGQIGPLTIWDRPLTHADVMRHMYGWREILEPRRILVSVPAVGGAPTLSDLQATSITASTVQGTYDYAF